MNHPGRLTKHPNRRPAAREAAACPPTAQGVRPRTRRTPRADSSDFAKNPAAGLSAISS